MPCWLLVVSLKVPKVVTGSEGMGLFTFGFFSIIYILFRCLFLAQHSAKEKRYNLICNLCTAALLIVIRS